MTSFGRALLDTDIVSLYFRRQPVVVSYAQKYLAENGRFDFSAITRFEILRGLKAKQATTRLKAFDNFCTSNAVLGIDDNIIVRAADIYADLHNLGRLIGDADILIGATALEHDLPLVNWNA